MHLVKKNKWMARTLRGLAVTTLLVSGLAATCSAQITFQYNFSGSFVTDPNAAAEQQAVIDGGKLFSSEFGKYFSNSATLVLNANGFNDPNVNTLATAGSDITFGANTPGLVNEVILQKLQTGVDVNGANADGGVNVNFAYPYSLDPNAIANGQFDLFAILDHELTHALGFGNFLDANGLGAGGFQQYGVWDTFLTDKNGNKILNPDFTVNQAAFDSAKLGTQNGGGFFFDGANAVAGQRRRSCYPLLAACLHRGRFSLGRHRLPNGSHEAGQRPLPIYGDAPVQWGGRRHLDRPRLYESDCRSRTRFYRPPRRYDPLRGRFPCSPPQTGPSSRLIASVRSGKPHMKSATGTLKTRTCG